MKSTYTDKYRQLLIALVTARKQSGLTQADLALRLGRPQSFVSKFENGERRLDVIEFVELCGHFGVDPATLLDKLC